jgi:Zn-dependent protease
MLNSWKLGRLCGIDIFLHWSFLIIPAWAALSSLAAGAGLVSAANATVFVLAVFGCVLLHELGHALAARHYGIGTHDITLLPIGGLARLERIPTQPIQEIVIALAGPAVNLVIAVALVAGLSLRTSLDSLTGFSPLAGSFLANLVAINIGLLVFNLLPALPMDGGRVLRALLAMMMPHAAATRTAATIAQFLAAGMGVFGLLSGSLNLCLVGLFVFFAAHQEASLAGAAAWHEGQPAVAPQTPVDERGAGESWGVLPAHARADEVTYALFRQPDYYFVAQGREVVGVLSKARLLWALANGYGNRLIVELADRTDGNGPQLAMATGRSRS